MFKLQGKPFGAGVVLPLLGVAMLALGAGCGRMVLGTLPGDQPDGGPDIGSDHGTGDDATGDTPAGDTTTGGGDAHANDAHVDSGNDAPGTDTGAGDVAPGDGSATDATGDASGDVPVVLPQVCTPEGWCWTHPLPTSDRFVQAYAIAPDDLWLLGASGTIVRYAGGVWSTIPSPPSDALAAIWASSSSDVWVGGSAGPFHWDGHGWTQIPPPTSPGARAVTAIWGCNPNNVWVMGVVATHWDGKDLTFVDMGLNPGGFRALWGTACDDVWTGFVDDSLGSGRVEHYDGNAWTTTETRPIEQLVGTGSD